MELKYIWVEKYNNIKELGFNFSHSGTDKFKFQDNVLKVISKKKPVLEFGDKISSITAIAGKNGSGKSSLCEIILHSIATLSNGVFGYEEDFKGIVCIGNYIFAHKEILINNIVELKEIGYSFEVFKNSPLEEMKFEWSETLQKTGFVYYSNVIDWRNSFEAMNLKNISSYFTLDQEISASPNYTADTFFGLFKEKRNFMSDLKIYWLDENYRIIDLYLHEPNLFQTKVPDHFKINLNYEKNNKWLESTEISDNSFITNIEDWQGQILDLLIDFPSLSKSANNIRFDEAKIKDCILKIYKLNVIKALVYSTKKVPDEEELYSFVWDDSDLIKFNIDVNKLMLAFKDLLKDALYYKDYSYKQLVVNHKNSESDLRIENFCCFWLLNNENGRFKLKRLIDLERKILLSKEKVEMRINNYTFYPFLSTGELSLFTLFSRLYKTVTDYQIEEDDLREELIIFIDEGDVGFHPAWKKNFLKWLVEFLNKDFNKFKIQLILTTHSPYLLSDLDGENLILLNRNGNGDAIIENTKNKTTFGANIHELLTESFFLEDGLIGEFAKDKIRDLIHDLKPENDLTYFGKEEIQSLIKIVAEPLIQDRLQKMFDEKFLDEIEIRRRIEELQEKLQKLNNEKN